MRTLVLGLVAASAVLSSAQTGGNAYTAKGADPQTWVINANHTLIWNGAPYLPVGLRIDGTPEEIARAKAAGFNDVIVDLPAGGTGWDEAIKALEAAKMRYLISISSLAPMAEGVAIEPGGNRVTGIKKSQKLEIRLPGATSALTVVVNQRDTSVAKVQRLDVLDGTLALDVKPYADLEQILLIYPHMRSLEQPDLWDALDEHRDRLLSTLRNHPPGPGLRGILNPLGHLAAWTRSDPHFVPTNPYFRYEFAAFLKQKYRSVETAMKAWSMTVSDIDSFDRLAKLAPLWSGPTRGVPQLWDSDSDKLYGCNSIRSQVWNDIQDAIADTAARRYARFTAAVRTVVNVPMLQEWAGWMPLYETANPPLDGIGMHVYGTTPSQLLDFGSRATSSLLRWKKPGWLAATEVDLGTAKDAAEQLPNVLDDLTSLGSRGWFLRSSAPDVVKVMVAQLNRSSDTGLAQYAPPAIFYPENAFNPATPQRLPGGRWWLPSSGNGNRLDFGRHFFGYRYQQGVQSYTALWTDLPAARVKLKMMEPKSATFAAVDGTLVDPRVSKDGVQVTIGSIPIIVGGTDEIPIPEPAYAETLFRMDALFALAETQLVDVTEPAFLFKDALSGFERNPGGSYFAMRQQFDRVSLRMAPYVWIEAESTKRHNFSELLPSAGCSDGGMLSLKTQIASPVGGYTADYTVPVKSEEDLEIWMAARIPVDQRKNVTLTVAGDTFTIQSEPVSLYGQGFGWYKLGVTKLAGVQTKMRLQVNCQSADMAFDAFMLFPGHFLPRGVTLPDAIVFPEPKKRKGGGRLSTEH
ncbi:MAG: hypothetical protein ACHQ50_06095 [Fimbriimonadales bacterium]